MKACPAPTITTGSAGSARLVVGLRGASEAIIPQHPIPLRKLPAGPSYC
jgi:hypothetical protein